MRDSIRVVGRPIAKPRVAPTDQPIDPYCSCTSNLHANKTISSHLYMPTCNSFTVTDPVLNKCLTTQQPGLGCSQSCTDSSTIPKFHSSPVRSLGICDLGGGGGGEGKGEMGHNDAGWALNELAVTYAMRNALAFAWICA